MNPGVAADRLAPSDGGLDLGQLFRVGAEQQRRVDVTAEAHGVRSVEQIKVACRSISWPDVSRRAGSAGCATRHRSSRLSGRRGSFERNSSMPGSPSTFAISWASSHSDSAPAERSLAPARSP